MHHCPTGAHPEEAEKFLSQHPDLKTIHLVLTDANGIARGKAIRRHELTDLYQKGRNLPQSVLGLDVCGEDVAETGLLWETGDGDVLAWPIPGTLKIINTGAPQCAEVLTSLYGYEGTPVDCDSRHVLASRQNDCARQSLFPAAAFELEFFLFQQKPDQRGMPVAVGGHASETNRLAGLFSLGALQQLQPLFDDIYRATELAGIQLETVISECAPGQFEFTLGYRASLLEAADELLAVKRLIRYQAHRHGIKACFMAKPFADHPGSGMHCHLSLANREGMNIFAENDAASSTSVPKWNAYLLHAIGGLQTTLAESMLIFAPHANSWRRFASKSYAPIAANWGYNNRSVALRIPASEPQARRIEHRVAGIDANSYLCGALLLAAIQKGLQQCLDPGEPTTGNGYEQGARLLSSFPVDWRSAMDAARSSTFVRNALGEGMHRVYMAIKQAEYARVVHTVPLLDYQLYLDQI